MTPAIIRYFKLTGIMTSDVHKKGNPLVPNSVGVAVAVGIIAGILSYIFLETFVLNNQLATPDLLAASTSVMIITFTGFLDDLNVKQINIAGHPIGRAGLKRWQKILMIIPAAFPLMVIKAGHTTMVLPFFGTIDFGILYPLVIVPVGIFGAANMVNMLDGFNGLAAGMGIVYTLSLGVFAYLHGSIAASILFLATFAALVAIIKFNWYPAKILSGDSLTYVLGAVVAIGAIIGNMEKAAIITMVPFIVQGILKFYARYKLYQFPTDMGILQKDDTIKSKYGNSIYSWTHLAMKLGNLTEQKIVASLIFIQIIFSILPLLNVF